MWLDMNCNEGIFIEIKISKTQHNSDLVSNPEDRKLASPLLKVEDPTLYSIEEKMKKN